MISKTHPGQQLHCLISATQRFSIHDGPGIRTLVFMKGCPLRCLWCENPETQQFTPQLLFASNRCIGCAKCVAACPNSAISLQKNGKSRTDRKRCRDCGTCTQLCPSGARTMVGTYMSVGELLQEIKKDTPFYNRSGGGVTVGGGEPAMQSVAVAELLRRSQTELNINTAIETCGFADYSALENIARYADLVFYDVKHIEPSRHRLLTGGSNQVIMDNLQRLIRESDKNIIIRTPVIPGYNDSEGHIRDLGEFAARLGNAIIRLELLPYHNYAAAKYVQLGRKYKLGKAPVPTSEHLLRLQEIIVATGVAVAVQGDSLQG